MGGPSTRGHVAAATHADAIFRPCLQGKHDWLLEETASIDDREGVVGHGASPAHGSGELSAFGATSLTAFGTRPGRLVQLPSAVRSRAHCSGAGLLGTAFDPSHSRSFLSRPWSKPSDLHM